MAEQLVAGAWMAELYAAVHDAEAALRAALHLRVTARSRMHAAQRGGDPERIVEAQQELELTEHDLAEADATFRGVSELLARELNDRPTASRVRILPKLPAKADANADASADATWTV
jgi:hypothetical protein